LTPCTNVIKKISYFSPVFSVAGDEICVVFIIQFNIDMGHANRAHSCYPSSCQLHGYQFIFGAVSHQNGYIPDGLQHRKHGHHIDFTA
jgi:hypothetical protein